MTRRRFFFSILLCAAFLSAGAEALFAQPSYIYAAGGIENKTIDTLRLGRTPDYFSSYWLHYAGGVEGEFNKNYTYKFTFQSDPFWQTTFNTGIGIKMGFLSIKLGVQIGLHDFSTEYAFTAIEFWNIGIDTGARFELPGIFFLGFDVVLDIGGGNWVTNKPGSAHRQFLRFAGGFWLPHILISGGYMQRDYDAIVSDILAIRAGQTRVYGNIEFFAKTVPFQIMLEAGKVDQLANYTSDSSLWAKPDETSYMYVGTTVTVDIGRRFVWYVKMEAPITGLRAPIFNEFSAISGIRVRFNGNR